MFGKTQLIQRQEHAPTIAGLILTGHGEILTVNTFLKKTTMSTHGCLSGSVSITSRVGSFHIVQVRKRSQRLIWLGRKTSGALFGC